MARAHNQQEAGGKGGRRGFGILSEVFFVRARCEVGGYVVMLVRV